MNKLAIPFTLAAAATLAACGGTTGVYEPATPAPTAAIITPVATTSAVIYPGNVAVVPSPGVVVQTMPTTLRAGYGRVESSQPVMYSNGASTGMTRFTLRMEDGSFQVLDTRGPAIAVGERVEITQERYIRYPIASRY